MQCTHSSDELLAELFDHGIDDVVVSAPPANLEVCVAYVECCHAVL